MAVKFADYLCPNIPTHPQIPEGKELPRPTEDLDQVMSDIRQFGYGLVKNALSPDEIQKLKSAVEQQARGEAAAGVAKKDGGPNAPNQRIWTLVNKGQEFHDLLCHSE